MRVKIIKVVYVCAGGCVCAESLLSQASPPLLCFKILVDSGNVQACTLHQHIDVQFCQKSTLHILSSCSNRLLLVLLRLYLNRPTHNCEVSIKEYPVEPSTDAPYDICRWKVILHTHMNPPVQLWNIVVATSGYGNPFHWPGSENWDDGKMDEKKTAKSDHVPTEQ